MSRKTITRFVLLASALFIALAGCATLPSVEHKYVMRGQILEVNGPDAYLCIGSEDGARVGQELTVYRFERTGNLSSKPSQRYKRVELGKLRITEIVDMHMANAKIISGEAREHDVVELK